MLVREELTRYSRNILLSEVGRQGQENLKQAKVAVVGTGGLGSPVLLYLAAVGVGNLTIIDSDTVDLTNLQRQVLFRNASVGKAKAEEARKTLLQLNPHLNLTVQNTRLQAENAIELLNGMDLVIEGADNFSTKFLVNDACYFLQIPFLTAGILQFSGTLLGVVPHNTACYRCVFHSPPPPGEIPSCAEAGVIGSVAGVLGSLQATEAIRYLLAGKNPQAGEEGAFGSLLQYEAKKLEFRKIALQRNTKCPLCGSHPQITDLTSSTEFCNF
ncbi:MAG: HesA/MoeB/ThiF family protein [Spirochaetota bacterium]